MILPEHFLKWGGRLPLRWWQPYCFLNLLTPICFLIANFRRSDAERMYQKSSQFSGGNSRAHDVFQSPSLTSFGGFISGNVLSFCAAVWMNVSGLTENMLEIGGNGFADSLIQSLPLVDEFQIEC